MNSNFLSKLNKKQFLAVAIVLAVLLTSGAIAYAGSQLCSGSRSEGNLHDCYKVAKSNTETAEVKEAWTNGGTDTCVKNAYPKDLFVPTNSYAEWLHFATNVLNRADESITFVDCPPPPPGGGLPLNAEFTQDCSDTSNTNTSSAQAKYWVNIKITALINALPTTTWVAAKKTAAINSLPSMVWPGDPGTLGQGNNHEGTVTNSGYTFTYITGLSFEDLCNVGPYRYSASIFSFQ